MTYPMDGLAVIAPILFMVMIIGFPLIGLAVGWKRALYWGAGNLVFYIIGLIIWKTAGGAIGVKIAEFLKQIESLKDVDASKLATSVAAPIFLLIILLIGNLLLLINYYAWFKKVAKIKADIAARKAIKAFKKECKEKGKKLPKVITVKTKDGIKVTEKPYGVRAGNRVIGLVAMPLLMTPVIASFTQAILYTTTSATTRANHKFAQGLYNSLVKTDKNVSWFSYYNGTTAEDLDSLFSGLELSNKEIEAKLYVDDPNSSEQIEVVVNQDGGKPTALNLITNNITSIISDEVVPALQKFDKDEAITLYTETFIATGGDEAAATKAVNDSLGTSSQPINKLSGTWNYLVDTCKLQLQTFFNSSNITELLKDIITKTINFSKHYVTDEEMTKIFGKKNADGSRTEGMYFAIVEQYTAAVEAGKEIVDVKITVKGKTFTFNISMLKYLTIKATSIKNVRAIVDEFVDLSRLTDQDKDVKLFNDAIDKIVSLILVAE